MPQRIGPLQSYRRALRNETFASAMLLLGAVIALIWANSPIRESYFTMANTVVGPEALHLNLPIASWVSDGVLAIFFFVVGLELKQEFVVGSLRDMRQAAVPMIAAAFGMAGPIAVYLLVQVITGSGLYGGWAVPVATDIAFALAVLGLFGKGLPPAVRTFLMTLAVVDDLLGILIIAILFSNGLNFIYLGLAFVCIAVFAALVQNRITHWYLLIPVAVLAWYFMHTSGIHATIAGVALGMMVPAKPRAGEKQYMTERFSHKLEFLSSGFVLPIFAFFASGVNIIDSGGIGKMLTDPVGMGVYLGLPIGKFIGISGGVWIMIKIFKLRLGNGVDLKDIYGVSIVAGVGFTVSLLIATLSFDATDPHGAHARVAVILGSVISVIIGGLVLRMRANQRIRHAGHEKKLRSTDPTD